jgi:phosphoadenosine phosphosulfate reductase
MIGGSDHTFGGRLRTFREDGLRVFATTSLQTQSLPLLHLIATRAPWVPVYFVNTGALFPETLGYRRVLERHFDIELHELRPGRAAIDARGRLHIPLFRENPDACCHRHKVLPLDPLLAAHDVWVNGVRADQTRHRAGMSDEENGADGVLRYRPLLRWTRADVERYITHHALPRHPLSAEGYRSIGCWPCSRATGHASGERDGRWVLSTKTECGLHLPRS